MLPSNLFKSDVRYLKGRDEVSDKNIEASHQLSSILRTSMGPNGQNKLVINHLEKIFITNDAATIVRELEVVHPAAKLLVMASHQQEREIGDCTNFVIVFAGELLQKARDLLHSGLHNRDLLDGYQQALEKAVETLPSLSHTSCTDLRDVATVARFLRTPLCSKQFGYEDLLSRLIARACTMVVPSDPRKFNVDNVRVAKVVGGSLPNSEVISGMCIVHDTLGPVKHVTDAKIAVFGCAVDKDDGETKGTIRLESAEELESYTIGEEERMREFVEGLAQLGVNVVVSGNQVGDVAQHYLQRHNIMVIKVLSKFDLRRLCRSINATALVRLGVPVEEELGRCATVDVEEYGATKVTVFRRADEESQVSTILVRGATKNKLDDIERAIDDGVNVYKAMARDGRFVPGGGASEIELARRIESFGETLSGLNQYAVKKFAEALEVVPRTLAENAGLNANEVVASLYAAHTKGQSAAGVNIEEGGVSDMAELGIMDLFAGKEWAIKLATEAAMTVLRVDQIIMSKPSGGPKPRAPGPQDA